MKTRITTIAYIKDTKRLNLARFVDKLDNNNQQELKEYMRQRVQFAKRFAENQLSQLANNLPSCFAGNEKIHLAQYAEIF